MSLLRPSRSRTGRAALPVCIVLGSLLAQCPVVRGDGPVYVFVTKWGLRHWWPYRVALDAAGNVYVADRDNHRVQKLTGDGTLVTEWGSEGSGNGEFREPYGIAVDGLGNVYVADAGNDRIQEFTSGGTFVRKWGSHGSGDGEFDGPHGVAVDGAGNVCVADTGNNRIQKFTSDGTFLAKWGSYGSLDGHFNDPEDLAVEPGGTVYVADAGNNRIQKFASDGTFLIKWGSEGQGEGQFRHPSGVALGPTGTVFVADTWNGRIQKFSSAGARVGGIGSPGSADGQFASPQDMAVDGAGNVYVADTSNHRMQKFANDGTLLTKWGTEGLADGEFREPAWVTLDAAGNVYVADTRNHRVQKFTSDGTFLAKWGSYGTADGQFRQPYGVAVDAAGNVYVADSYNDRIEKFTGGGTFLTGWGSEGSGDGQFDWPEGLAVDTAGNVYVVDSSNNRIQKFTSGGTFLMKWGSWGDGDGQFDYPVGVAVDAAGYVYVADTGHDRVEKFAADGTFLTKWGGSGHGDGQFDEPYGLAVDGAGNVYVADGDNNRVQKFTSDGTFLTKWGERGLGDGQFRTPGATAVDAAGNVYVADTWNDRIQKFAAITPPGDLDGDGHVDVDDLAAFRPHWGAVQGGSTKARATCGTYDSSCDLNGDGQINRGDFWMMWYDNAPYHTEWVPGDVTGASVGQGCPTGYPDAGPDDYLDFWDLVAFADHWQTASGDSNWDECFDFASSSGLAPPGGPKPVPADGTVSFHDLMAFAAAWHTGEGPAQSLGAKSLQIASSSDASVWVTVDPCVVAAGDETEVAVHARLNAALDTYDVTLRYDPSVFRLVRDSVQPTDYLKSRGAEALYMKDLHERGVVSLTGSIVGHDAGKAPEGEGVLARFKLKALKPTDETSIEVADAHVVSSNGDVWRAAPSEAATQILTWGATDWRARVVARAGERQDSDNFFGMAKGAAEAPARDEAAADEPLRLTFRLPAGGSSSADYRPPQAPPLTYRFDVVCALPHSEVSLELSDLSLVPRAYHLRLVDESADRAVSLRTRNSYRYQTGAIGGVRSFRIEVTDGSPGELIVSGVSATPGRGGETISYTLSTPANVDVEIRNMAGRLIRRLCEAKESPAGRGEVGWDERCASGTIVPGGTYLIRVRARAEDGERASGMGMLHVVR